MLQLVFKNVAIHKLAFTALAYHQYATVMSFATSMVIAVVTLAKLDALVSGLMGKSIFFYLPMLPLKRLFACLFVCLS